MNNEEINNGNRLIAEFMGLDVGHDGMILQHGRWTPMLYYVSWGWLMPVVRRIVEYCSDIENEEAFMSDEYTDLLEIVPLAIIDDAYKSVIKFITWLNNNKDG